MRSLKNDIRDMLNMPVPLSGPGKQPKVTTRKAALLKLREKALKGDSRSLDRLIEFAREHPSYRYFPETGEERYTSLLAAPLVVQSAVIGVIVIQTVEPRRFEEADVELLQTCASLLAPVVVNAQLLASTAALVGL